MLGGLAAGAAASARNSYSGTAFTPYGTYHFQGSYPSLAGQLRANQISNDTAFTLAALQYRLDETRERLANNLVQLNTVDPGQMYGGRIILGKLSSSKLPQDVRVTVNWNGASYPFAFRVVKSGTPEPAFTNITPASPPDFVKAAGPPSFAQPAGVQPIMSSQFPIKFPAKTASGYCMVVPPGYRGTNSPKGRKPVVTAGTPVCPHNQPPAGAKPLQDPAT